MQKVRAENENRRVKIRDTSVDLVAGPSRQSNIASMPEEHQRKVLKAYAQSLGLYPAWWDRIPKVIPTSLVMRRVYGRLEELEVDDLAIDRDGGVGRMEGEEVRMACEEVKLYFLLVYFASLASLRVLRHVLVASAPRSCLGAPLSSVKTFTDSEIVQRGIDVLEKEEENLRRDLKLWMDMSRR